MITIKVVFTPTDDQGLLSLIYLNVNKLKNLFKDEIKILPETDILNNGPPYIEFLNKRIYISNIGDDLIEIFERIMNKKENNTFDENLINSIKRDKLHQDGVYAY
ncbi:MAG: hypothetical protein QXV69_06840 [Sulfolobaceae archaeon]